MKPTTGLRNRPCAVIVLTTATVALHGWGCGSGGAEAPVATTWPATATAPAAATGPAGTWEPPMPASAHERVQERAEMVARQIAHPVDGRQAVTDPRVLQAMRIVPRHVFVPKSEQAHAYADSPLPIGHGQTISQPYIVALMTELAAATPQTRVLEIGTGSGYQAAVLAQLTPHVYTIELLEPLAQRAQESLRREGYDHVYGRRGDGFLGWPEAGPFDVIMLTCAIDEVPEPLWNQLKAGGRIVMPLGGQFQVQQLVVISKTDDGRRQTRRVIPVRFVPLVREKGD